MAAALLLFYVKKNQRGHYPTTQNTDVKVPVNEGFDRNFKDLIFTKHARCRMDCRHIDESEVVEVIKNGTINYEKIEKDDRGRTYPLEGITHDKQHVRVVVAPKEGNELVLVTVIDLDRDWACDCK
ncbi:DUF4258 domain-containing protein [Ferruginibacter lapsinanis]|uniref:DUF4258 domain-containing protein n=1 Tax=Ferruginibacter lapsinanis TaxID=563172 RepID=UPI001E3B135B|nr:DUF4258 domain-containing protein [Ferruginibacter lapsinanis]UEG49820.1 DUF4258 domain-containing protein [Ferruginibacter lapsinanis]